MKFTFRLERLLDLRLRAEDDCKLRLAQGISALREASDAIERTQAAQDDLQRSWKQAVAEGLCAPDAADYQQCALALERELEIRKKALVHAECALSALQKDLDVAVAKRRALEKFKDRNQRSFQLAEQLSEQKTMDDIAMLRAGGAA